MSTTKAVVVVVKYAGENRPTLAFSVIVCDQKETNLNGTTLSFIHSAV